MQLLLDENFPKPAVDALHEAGHDVLWIRAFAPGTKDKDILLLAAQQQRIILTLDKDFQYLLHKPGSGGYGIIVLRVHPAVPDRIIPVVLKVLKLEFDWFGHVSVVSENAVRMFPFLVVK